MALPRQHADHLLAELRRRDAQRQRVATQTGAKLTDREWQVLQLLGDEASTAEIARRLQISQVTVRRHVGLAIGKLAAQDRAAALRVLEEAEG